MAHTTPLHSSHALTLCILTGIKVQGARHKAFGLKLGEGVFRLGLLDGTKDIQGHIPKISAGVPQYH